MSLTDKQLEDLQTQVEVWAKQFQHSDAVVMGRSDFQKVRRAVEAVAAQKQKSAAQQHLSLGGHSAEAE